ncbi:hypothetical protein FB446DRAFT_505305 [Lentinula raphanica]|nr:hypothetical protein FB446DRAFT_505305 [Lentinula raphanica]
MGQYWRLINIDKREATSDMGKLQEFFYDQGHIVDYLIPLVLPSKYRSDLISLEDSIQKFARKNPSTSASTAILLTLPVELLLLIVDELSDDYLPLLCFSLTCTFLWDITGQARYHSLSSSLNKLSWAGDRIILLGDWARLLPSSMLSDEEVEELKLDDSPSDTLAEALIDAARGFPEPPNMNSIGPLYDRRVQTNPDFEIELWDILDHDSRFRPWIWLHWRDFKVRKPEGDRWMVRNLSKREYVTKASSRDLTQMIYCLIGYSDDGDSAPRGSEWLVHGVWAGDRIDITLVSVHQQEHGNELDWKDVTVGVKQQLREVVEEDGYRDIYLSD